MASTSKSGIGALHAEVTMDSTGFQAGAAKVAAGAEKLKGKFKTLPNDVGAADKSFNKAAGSLKTLEGRSILGAAALGKLKSGALGVAAGLATAFGGVTALALGTAANAKEITRMSTALGMSKDSYQVLTGSAKEFGLEQDKVGDILKDSNEKLGEFVATGGGGFKDFMEQIAMPAGVSGQDLAAMMPMDRMIKIQQLMDDQNVSLEKQSFYWEGIGSDATYLIPLLKNGGKALREQETALRSVGAILSDDVIGNLNGFSKNATSIGNTFKGWGNTLVSGLAPQLEAASGKLDDFLKNATGIRAVFKAVGEFDLSKAVGAIGMLAQAVGVLVAGRLGSLAVGFAATVLGAGRMGAAMMAAVIQMRAMSVASALATGGLGILRGALALVGGPIGLVIAGASLLALNWGRAEQKAKDLAASLKKVAEAQKSLTQAEYDYKNNPSSETFQANLTANDAKIVALQEQLRLAQEQVYAKTAVMGSGNSQAGEDAAKAEYAAVNLELQMAQLKAVALTGEQAKWAGQLGITVQQYQEMNEAQRTALATANEMTASNERALQLAQVENAFGKDSLAALATRISQEQAIYIEKVNQMNVEDAIKNKLIESYMAAEQAKNQTQLQTAAMTQLSSWADQAYSGIKNIAASQPGNGWLSTAINRAATLAAKLWDGVRAARSLPGMDTGSTAWAKNSIGFTLPGADLIPPKDTSTGSGGGSTAGGDGGTSPEQQKADASAAAVKSLTDKYNEYKATLGMTDLQEKIYQATKDITDQKQKQNVANMVTEIDMMERTKKVGEGVTNTLAGIFAAAVQGSGAGINALKAFGKQLAAVVAQNAFKKLFGGILGSIFGGVNPDSFFGGVIKDMGWNANGTNGFKGGMSVVGERGPELVKLPTGSAVYSNSDSRRMLSESASGGNTSVHISLDQGLVASIKSDNNANAVSIVQQNNKESAKAFNGLAAKYGTDARSRG